VKKKKADPEDVESGLVLETHECTRCHTYFKYHAGQVVPYFDMKYVRCPVCSSEQFI